MMRILALDLASHTGWAFGDGGNLVVSGTHSFKPCMTDYGHLAHAFGLWLADMVTTYEPHMLVSERVVHRGASTVPLMCLFGKTQEVGFIRELQRREVNPVHLKKWATGNARAKKAAMVEWAQHQGYWPKSHDEADALALLHYARGQFSMTEAA
jgi:crossover junction endodeoxyribonuclease RuvC